MAKAIVIGAGIAGIASALRLRKKGYEVEVYEANAYAGGKIHAFEREGFRFDMGPSLFTMPQLVDELYQLFDLDPRKYFNYKAKEVLCNYFWEDGTIFSARAGTFVEDAAEVFNTPPEKIEAYLLKNKKKYETTAGVFLEKSLHKLDTYFSRDTLRSLLSIHQLDIDKSLHQLNQQYFSNPHLVQLFDRYATYNGSSPYKTPGIMSLIPHLEMHYGTYFPRGGMHAISQSLYHLAEDRGIRFFFQRPVLEILHKNGQAHGIRTGGEKISADLIVSNMDIFSTYKNLLREVNSPKRVLRQERSSSALIFYWGIDRRFPELDLHNILFSKEYKEEFRHIFEGHGLHDDPTIYINITSKEEKEDAPQGSENWFVMINTPGNFGQDWERLKQEARKNIVGKIKRTMGIDIESHIVLEEVLDPVKIESQTSSHRGALYGSSSNSKFAAFLRHPNFSSQLKGLYFCGGSVHPGGGIPLCLLSAKIVGDLIPKTTTN